MIEFWLTHEDAEIFRQTLEPGLYQLGRSSDNDLKVASPHISRNHLQIDASQDQLRLTDLGSTNGFRLNGQQMPPHQAYTVMPGDRVEIGPLQLHFQPLAQAQQPAPSHFQPPPPASSVMIESGDGITIYCAQAHPNKYDLRVGTVTVGSTAGNALRISLPEVASQHVLIRLSHHQVEVVRLSADHPASKSGVELPVGEPVPWDRNEPLLLGPAGLVYTPLQATPRRQPRREGRSSWLLTAGGLGALAFVALCLIAAGIFAYTRFGPDDGIGPLVDNDNGPATPTLAPTRFNELQITRPDGQVQIVTVTPPPTISTADCAPAVVAEDNSFLDLPFPYRGIDPLFGGSGDEFRRISQRTRFGGRINSFFDHEYPVYPPAFGGWEPVGIDLTMVLFDGTRSTDAFVQDAVDGDWYSGHAGIDFAPVNPLREDTPILAAAAGRLQLVTIYDDGNHAIWLTHDPDGDGTYQYATLYFHIFPDQYWDNMMARYLAANDAGTFVEIAAGERIGTMGTTGRSTGIHLHFEVRHDVNRPFGTFDQYEKVDPYGFFPGEDVEVDPWSEPVTWVDTKGVEREHSGVTSDYLWTHPLVEVDANDAAVSCVIDIRYSADIRGLIGWTVIDPGFTVAIRNRDGQIVAQGEPQTRRVTIRAEELEGVNRDSVSLDYFEPEAGVWVTVGTAAGLVQQANGDYTYTASVDRTGQYVLVAEQSVDFVPPTTRIELDGNRLPGGNNYFQGSVSVSLNATDAGLPAPSGIDTIQYSLDCGDTWQTYSAPFTVTAANMGACGTGVSDQGLQLGDNELLLLAIASDKNGNIEQPASQMFIAVTP